MDNQAKGPSGINEIKASRIDFSMSPQGTHTASITAVRNAPNAFLTSVSDMFLQERIALLVFEFIIVGQSHVAREANSRNIKIEGN